MTVIDVIAALSEGSLPTNAQILAWLSVIEARCDAGKDTKLQRDTLDLLHSLRGLVTQRNANEEIQEIIWEVRGGVLKLEELISREELEKRRRDKEKRKGKADGKTETQYKAHLNATARKLYTHGFTLLRTVLIQPKLRHLVLDCVNLLVQVGDETFVRGKTAGGTDTNRALSVQDSEAIQKNVQGALAELKAQKANASAVAEILRGSASGMDVPAVVEALRANGNGAAVPAVVEALRSGNGFDVQGVVDALRQSGNASAVPAVVEALRAQGGGIDVPAVVEALRAGVNGNAALEPAVPQPATPDATSVPQPQVNGIAAPDATAVPQAPLNGPASSNGRTQPQLNGAAQPQLNGAAQSQPNRTAQPQPNGTALPTSTSSTGSALAAQPTSASASDALQLLTIDGLLARVTEFNPQSLASQTSANLRTTWQAEGRARVLKRVRQLLIDVQGSPSSQASLLWFVRGVEKAIQGVVTMSEAVAAHESKINVAAAPHVISLAEQFVGVGKVGEILSLTRRLSVGYHADESVRAVVGDARAFAYRCIEEAGWVLEKQCEVDFHSLVERFKSLGETYKTDTEHLLHLLSTCLTALKTDPYLLSLLSTLKHLSKDLTLSGTPLPSKTALNSLVHTLLPPLFNHSVLPIPRIKYTHPDFILVLENIAISLRDLIPDTIDLRVTNDVHFDIKRVRTRSLTHTHSFKLKIKGLGLRIHKVAFAVDLLKGIKLHDKGILDLCIADVGVSIYIDIPRDGPNIFTIRRVRSRLGRLSIKVHQSNHFILHKLAEGLVDSRLTKLILRNLMSKGITLGLKQLNVALMQLKLNGWVLPKSTDDTPHMIRLKKQAAELRDAMRRIREQAGTLEVDFLDAQTGVGVAEKWKSENKGWLDWVKGVWVGTGREVTRGERWKCDVFDLREEEEEGVEVAEKVMVGEKPPMHEKVHAGEKVKATMGEGVQIKEKTQSTANTHATETPSEAARRHKPQGPTTQATVEDADATVRKQKKKYWPWFAMSRKRNGKVELKGEEGRRVKVD